MEYDTKTGMQYSEVAAWEVTITTISTVTQKWARTIKAPIDEHPWY